MKYLCFLSFAVAAIAISAMFSEPVEVPAHCADKVICIWIME